MRKFLVQTFLVLTCLGFLTGMKCVAELKEKFAGSPEAQDAAKSIAEELKKKLK